jgi:hypothetical protein
MNYYTFNTILKTGTRGKDENPDLAKHENLA